ncbi:hypothetical protein EDC04DRAFT_2902468 [Pisolithus marmoratus]|nr:hypothetical protein EDC04DRAFT_2902468 [Pisolithus marmoratus]
MLTNGSSSESDSSSSSEKLIKRARAWSHNPSPETYSMGDSKDDWQLPMEPSAEDINFLFPDISDVETYTHLINLAIRTGDDPSDETWLPASRSRQQKKSTGRPSEYKKGPDIGSNPPSPSPSPSSNASPIPSSPSHTPDPLEVPEQLPFPSNYDGVHIESDGIYTMGTSRESREAYLVEHDLGLIQGIEDAWEDELMEQEHGGVEVQGWDELWDQIKDDLAKGTKTLPLSHINQLLLICNFATLQLQCIG